MEGKRERSWCLYWGYLQGYYICVPNSLAWSVAHVAWLWFRVLGKFEKNSLTSYTQPQ